MTDAMLSWLRSQIESDKATAEEFGGEAWTAQEDGDQGSFLSTDGPATGKSRAYFGLAYCYGRGAEAEHMARHDPRDTIARCEAELALLDKAEKAIAEAKGSGGWSSQSWGEIDGRADAFLDAVTLLASGYKHRPGYGSWEASE